MKKLLVCLAVSTMLFTGCTFSPIGNNTIIKVNDISISKAEFDNAFDKNIDTSVFKNFGGAKNVVRSDDNPLYAVYKEATVNQLIIKALIDDEIKKKNIKATKDDIQAELKNIIDKVGSKDELNMMLKARGISNAEFMEGLKTQIKIKKLVNTIEKVEVSDSDVKKYYDSNPDKFIHGEEVRASHILISANYLDILRTIKTKNPDISSEQLNTEIEKIMSSQKAKAEAILAEVKKNPQDFEKIAAQKSEDKSTAVRGGDLGFFSKDKMVDEFANAAFALQPNTISDLVQTKYGYHIIKVTDRIEAGTTPFAKVKDEIKFYLESDKQIKVINNLTTGLMKTAKIEYVDETFNPAKKINVTPKPDKTEEQAQQK